MDHKWTVDSIIELFEEINKAVGLEVSCEFENTDKSKFPLSRRDGKFVFVPEFFNHELISDDERNMIVVALYSCTYLDKNKDGHLYTYPDYLAKGICNIMGYKYIPECELESSMRKVRKKLYDEPDLCSYFSAGDELRISLATRLKVIQIQKEADDIKISIEPVGYCRDKYKGKTVFEEKELYDLAYGYKIENPIINGNTIVSLKKNLFVLSAPSGTGKNSLYARLKEKMPTIQRVITSTTREKRVSEVNGVDYFFLTEDEFVDKENNNEFVETNYYSDAYYGSPREEILRYGDKNAVFMIIDTHGKDQVIREFPLATTIFVSPPSLEELKCRIEARGDTKPEDIEWRISEARKEMEKAKEYDYILVNSDLDQCADELMKIVEEKQKGF